MSATTSRSAGAAAVRAGGRRRRRLFRGARPTISDQHRAAGEPCAKSSSWSCVPGTLEQVLERFRGMIEGEKADSHEEAKSVDPETNSAAGWALCSSPPFTGATPGSWAAWTVCRRCPRSGRSCRSRRDTLASSPHRTGPQAQARLWRDRAEAVQRIKIEVSSKTSCWRSDTSSRLPRARPGAAGSLPSRGLRQGHRPASSPKSTRSRATLLSHLRPAGHRCCQWATVVGGECSLLNDDGQEQVRIVRISVVCRIVNNRRLAAPRRRPDPVHARPRLLSGSHPQEYPLRRQSIRLIDEQPKPKPTRIDAVGMDVYLLTEDEEPAEQSGTKKAEKPAHAEKLPKPGKSKPDATAKKNDKPWEHHRRQGHPAALQRGPDLSAAAAR